MSNDKPSTSMTRITFESKLGSVVRSSMYPCPRNGVAIGHAVVYYAWAAHAFSAGIKYWHYVALNTTYYDNYFVSVIYVEVMPYVS